MRSRTRSRPHLSWRMSNDERRMTKAARKMMRKWLHVRCAKHSRWNDCLLPLALSRVGENCAPRFPCFIRFGSLFFPLVWMNSCLHLVAIIQSTFAQFSLCFRIAYKQTARCEMDSCDSVIRNEAKQAMQENPCHKHLMIFQRFPFSKRRWRIVVQTENGVSETFPRQQQFAIALSGIMQRWNIYLSMNRIGDTNH